MKNISNKLKRVLAVAIALVMVFGACFTGAVAVSAEGVDLAALGETVDTVATMDTNLLTVAAGGTFNGFVSDNGEGKGVHLNSTYNNINQGGWYPYCINYNFSTFPGMGVALQFANYTQVDPAADYSFVLAFASWYDAGSALYQHRFCGAGVNEQRPGIAIDTINGQVQLVKSTGVAAEGDANRSAWEISKVIIENDAFKYANFTGKPFRFEFKNTLNAGEIRLDVTVGEETFTGSFTQTELTTAPAGIRQGGTYDYPMRQGKTYIDIGTANRWGKYQVDFIGYSAGLKPDYADDIETFATTDMNGLQSVHYNGFETQNKYGVHVGVSSGIGQGGQYVFGINHNFGGFAGDGFTLQFANYVNTSAEQTPFILALADRFSNSKNQIFGVAKDQTSSKRSRPAIGIDTVNGEIQLLKNTAAYDYHNYNSGSDMTANPGSAYVVAKTIAQNDALKYANFTGKPFRFTFTDAGGLGTKVEVKVGETVVSGYVTKSEISTAPAGNEAQEGYIYPTVSDCYIDFGLASRWGSYSVDFIGYTEFPKAPYTYADEIQEFASASTAKNGNISYCTFTDIEGGGVTYNCTGNGAYYPYVYTKDLCGFVNPFTLYFDNYFDTSAANANGHGQFLITLNQSIATDTYYKFKNDCIGINVDTVAGKVELRKSVGQFNDQGELIGDGMNNSIVLQDIITDNIFKYDNFSGQEFTVTFELQRNGDIKVTFNVGGIEVDGTILAENIAGSTRFANNSNCFVCFGNRVNHPDNKCKVDFYGYRYLPAEGLEGLDAIATMDNDMLTQKNAVYTHSNIGSGGVALSYTRLSGYFPYQYDRNMGAFPGAGFTLRFDKYVNSNTDHTVRGDGIILITLANTAVGDAMKFKPGVPAVLIDTNKGDVELVSVNDAGMQAYTTLQTIISNNDYVKYANLNWNTFEVSFVPNGNAAEVRIGLMGSENYASGVIDMEKFYGITNEDDIALGAKDNTFVSIGGIDNVATNNAWSINFYGNISNAAEEDAMLKNEFKRISQFNGFIDEDVEILTSLSDAEKVANVYNAAAWYAALDAEEKESIEAENVTKLNNAVAALNALVAAQNYKPYATYLAANTVAAAKAGQNSYISTTGAETDDGFTLNWVRATNRDGNKPIVQQTVDGLFKLDGLRLAFNDFDYTYQSEMFVNFTSGKIGTNWSAANAANSFAIMLGREDGRLMLYTNGAKSGVSLGASDILKRDNLVDKQINLQFVEDSGNYVLYITVGTDVVGFTIDADALASSTGLDLNNVRVVLSTVDMSNAFTISCNGIYAENETAVQNVVNAVEGITAANYATVRASYNALTAAQQEHVFNARKIAEMRTAARVVTNGTDAEGYYIPVAADINRANGSNGEVADAAAIENGGIRMDFSNTVYGMRSSLKDHYVTEDLTLRFDNYRAGNGEGFIFGITTARSAKNDDVSWNKLAETGRYGIFFLVKNGSVYATKPFQANTMDKLFDSAKLTDEYLQNKEFTFRFVVNKTAQTIKLTVAVEGENLILDATNSCTYMFNSTYVRKMDQFLLDPDRVQVIVQSDSGYKANAEVAVDGYKGARDAFNIDLSGIKFKPVSDAKLAQVQAVINQINALPATATLANKAAINAAWDAYFQLANDNARELVTNFNKLLALHDELFALEAGTEYTYSADVTAYDGIDNSKFVDAYKPDSELAVDAKGWPEYTKDLVMAEVCISSATEEGTFQAMEPVLAHLAETGVNGIWLMPVEDRGTDTLSPYCNFGPNTISPYMTGQIAKGEEYDTEKVDYDAGKAVMADFIELAHSYNIRVFVDKVPWGLANSAPMVESHPEWFKGDSEWGGQDFVTAEGTNRTALLNWYKSEVVDFMLDTGADGIRWDLEPNYFGYDFDKEVLNVLRSNGKKPLFFSEDFNDRTNDAFAFEQVYGVDGYDTGAQTFGDVFFFDTDITAAVKNGNNIANASTSKYIAYQLSSHDTFTYTNASQATWAYSFTMSPFIPIFKAGEEYNTSASNLQSYKYDASEVAANQAYYENIKKLFQIRYQYKDIIINNADQLKNTNICKVAVKGTDLVQGYARYAGNQAIVVVPNVNADGLAADLTVNLPLADMGLNGYSKFTVTDLLNGDMIASGAADDIRTFTQNIAADNAGVYLVSGVANDFTWDLDGTVLTISANGAIDTAAWLAAATQATKVVVEEGVTSLPAGAFANFTKLEEIVLPASLNTIGANAFANVEDATVIAPQGATAFNLVGDLDKEYISLKNDANDITLTNEDGSGIAYGTTLNVVPASSADVNAIFKGLKAVMFDITMMRNSVAVQPDGNVIVTIPVPAGFDVEKIKVYNVDGNAKTEIDCTVANGIVSFVTNHFSNYAVVEYQDKYYGDFELNGVVYDATNGKVIVRTLKEYADQLQEFKAVFGANEVAAYTVIDANTVEFTFDVTGSGTLDVKLAALNAGEEVETDVVTINLARFADKTGCFSVYNTLPCGDANADGAIDIKDLARLKKAVAGSTANDITGDGETLANDIVALAKLLLVGKKGMPTYKVTFKNTDESVIAVEYVLEGFAAPAKEAVTPGKIFSNWNVDLSAVAADTVAVAVYNNDSTDAETDPEWGYDE